MADLIRNLHVHRDRLLADIANQTEIKKRASAKIAAARVELETLERFIRAEHPRTRKPKP